MYLMYLMYIYMYTYNLRIWYSQATKTNVETINVSFQLVSLCGSTSLWSSRLTKPSSTWVQWIVVSRDFPHGCPQYVLSEQEKVTLKGKSWKIQCCFKTSHFFFNEAMSSMVHIFCPAKVISTVNHPPRCIWNHQIIKQFQDVAWIYV